MESYFDQEPRLLNEGTIIEETKVARNEEPHANITNKHEDAVPLEVWNGLQSALEKGDSLPDTEDKLKTPVKRRALLVAPRYKINQDGWPTLESTPNDVWRIYNMLLQYEYDPAHIRILVEGVGKDEKYHPTKDNIKQSLQWLVKGADAGDYRYFHYSGHGDVFKTTAATGKAASRIPDSPTAVKPGDSELSLTTGSNIINKRIYEENESTDVEYYNEAIIAQWTELTFDEEHSLSKDELRRIRDEELNAAFAQLPKGCILTCSLDCCHSGRMINNNFKLAGSGFRGRLLGSTEEQKIQAPFQSLPKIGESDLGGDLTFKDDVILRDGSIDRHSLAVEILTHRVPTESALSIEDDGSDQRGSSDAMTLESTRAWLSLAKPMRNFFMPPLITRNSKVTQVSDVLPEQESQRDHIVANMLVWSGCHQRQLAQDHEDKFGGYFTYAFTEAVQTARKLTETVTVQKLHESVDHNVLDALKRYQRDHPEQKPQLQYTQLWTSLGDGNEVEARAKLDLPFIV